MVIQGVLKISAFFVLFTTNIKLKISTACQVLVYSILFSHITFIPYVHAGPTGGEVIGGSGTINQSGLTTTIDQASSRMATNQGGYRPAAD